MEKKKVVAIESGFKNRQLRLVGDIFEVNKDEFSSWYEDVEKKEVKPKRQYQKSKQVTK